MKRLPVKRITVCAACIASALLTLLLCGCRPPEKKSDGVTVGMICEHLEEKYGDEFTLTAIASGTEGGGKLELKLCSKQFPDDEIRAKATMDGYYEAVVGKDVISVPRYSFKDNYAAYKHRSQFMELITGCTREIYGECKVCYTVPDRLLPDGMGSLGFEEYITSMNSGLAYTVFLPPSAYSHDYREKMESLYTRYAQSNYQIDANVYYLSRQEDYDGITNENYYDCITKAHADRDWYIAFGYYHLDGLLDADCEWREPQKQEQTQ